MPETSTFWLPKLQFNLALEQNVLFQKTLIQLHLYFAMPGRREASLSHAPNTGTCCPGEWGPQNTVSSLSPPPLS